jgi:DNA replication protein DnaC
MNTTSEDIIKYSKELKLPVFQRDFKELATEAATQRLDYEDYLLRLMEREFELRLENRKKTQIRLAGFSAKMYLTHLPDFDNASPNQADKQLSELITLMHPMN